MIKKQEKNDKDLEKRGITLIALVITIVILIILATVTISVVFGEGGLIDKAQGAKDLTEQAKTEEEQELLNTEAHLNELLSGTYVPEEPKPDNVLATPPKLTEGMIPVKYIEGTGWVKTDETDSSWYNYGEKRWANVVLGEATFTQTGEQEVLDESKAYSMLVWIPRYAYKITSQYHEAGETAGNIDIVFIDTANKGKDGSTTYSTTYPEATVGGAMSDYVVHPAFNYGGTALPGFWVGKFETSHTGCTADKATGETDTNVTTLTLQIKAGVTSWRSISVSNIFTVCTELNKAGNIYGLNSSDSIIDPHMIKNSEWGACSYLSQNTTYGKGEEIWINNSSSYITGSAGGSVSANEDEGTINDYKSSQGQKASTNRKCNRSI